MIVERKLQNPDMVLSPSRKDGSQVTEVQGVWVPLPWVSQVLDMTPPCCWCTGDHITSCMLPELTELFPSPPQPPTSPLVSLSLCLLLQGRAQMSPRKEPTVTSAVGALLQNRALETSAAPTRPGELE